VVDGSTLGSLKRPTWSVMMKMKCNLHRSKSIIIKEASSSSQSELSILAPPPFWRAVEDRLVLWLLLALRLLHRGVLNRLIRV
jgi:hypothetical protein